MFVKFDSQRRSHISASFCTDDVLMARELHRWCEFDGFTLGVSVAHVPSGQTDRLHLRLFGGLWSLPTGTGTLVLLPLSFFFYLFYVCILLFFIIFYYSVHSFITECTFRGICAPCTYSHSQMFYRVIPGDSGLCCVTLTFFECWLSRFVYRSLVRWLIGPSTSYLVGCQVRITLGYLGLCYVSMTSLEGNYLVLSS